MKNRLEKFSNPIIQDVDILLSDSGNYKTRDRLLQFLCEKDIFHGSSAYSGSFSKDPHGEHEERFSCRFCNKVLVMTSIIELPLPEGSLSNEECVALVKEAEKKQKKGLLQKVGLKK